MFACFPVVEADELQRPDAWSKPVVIRAPDVGVWNRRLTCKSKHCGYAGIAVRSGASLMPVRYASPGEPWGLRDLTCVRAKDGKCDEPSQDAPSDRPWLGIVRPFYDAPGVEPKLTFELVGIAASAATTGN